MVQSQGLTLLVEDNDQLALFYQLNLKIWVGAQVRRATSIKELETFLQKNKNVALIISKASFSEVAKNYIEADNLREISHITIGKKPLEGAVNVENGLNIKPLMQAAAKALGVTAENMAKMQVPEHFPIDLNCFRSLKAPACDVFSVDTDGYKLRFPKDVDIDQKALSDLASAGHDSLYVLRHDRLKMVNNITQEIVSTINPNLLNEDENLSANEMSQKLLQYKLEKIGISNETVTLAQKNINRMVRSSKKFPKISQLVDRLLKNKAGYLYKHSQILMYVCAHLMENIDWGNDEQKKTINFVAFFHDIALSSDEQAKIHSEEQLKNSKLNEKEKSLVNMHAQIAAELVQKFPHAPMGADVIVRQHHGIAHGVGFSQHYGGNLSPMSIVFILAEDFVDYIIESGDKLDIKKKIEQMRGRYTTQRFKKIIDILEDITL